MAAEARALHAPRSGDHTVKGQTEAYTKLLTDAERIAGTALEHLIDEYLRILAGAAEMYARAAERGHRAYVLIEAPARQTYERQLEIADQAYNAITQPAQLELDRINKDAKRMFDEGIKPIEQGLAEAITVAQALITGIQLGQGKTRTQLP